MKKVFSDREVEGMITSLQKAIIEAEDLEKKGIDVTELKMNLAHAMHGFMDKNEIENLGFGEQEARQAFEALKDAALN